MAAAQPPPTSTDFAFPREYHFPAFFTRQPNPNTHHAQLTKWASLILAYARHHRLYKLPLSSAAADSDLFYNRTLDRRLHLNDVRDVVDLRSRSQTKIGWSSTPRAVRCVAVPGKKARRR